MRTPVTNNSAYFVLGDANTTSNFGIVFAYFDFESSRLRFFVNAAFSYYYPGTQVDTWYHIEMKNINWSAKTYDLWINNVQVQSDFPFRSTASTSMSRLYLYNFGNGIGRYDEILITNDAPEIAVTGNAVNIVDGDTTPALADHTDFGGVAVASGMVVRTYTVANSGAANLTLGSVTVGGTHAANFTVSLAPTSPVAASDSTTFQVTFDPSATGVRSATLSFSNDDTNENPFNFSIQGTGTAVTVTPTSGLVTTEAGGTATFTVVLAAPPTGNVSIALSSSDLTEGAVTPTSLTFTTSNWNTPQTVTVTGVSDGLLDGDIAYTIITGATSADPGYNGIAVADVSVTNTDDGPANLGITKSDGQTAIVPGQTVTYTITASNAGPATTTATVTDSFPAACGTVSWTCGGSGGGSCTASGSGNLSDAVVLSTGGSVTYTAPCTVSGSASGSLVNTATITSSNDPNTSNNSATDTDTITCTYALTPLNQVVNAGATTGMQVTVTTQAGCAWTATSPVPWVATTGGSAGTGSGIVTYTVTANPGPNPRRGTLTVAGKPFIVSQRTPVPAPCTISASTSATPVAVGGETGRTVSIAASTPSCAWSAKSHVVWITFPSAATGSGTGTVTFNVEANGTGLPRKGRITVNGKRVTVAQD